MTSSIGPIAKQVRLHQHDCIGTLNAHTSRSIWANLVVDLLLDTSLPTGMILPSAYSLGKILCKGVWCCPYFGSLLLLHEPSIVLQWVHTLCNWFEYLLLPQNLRNVSIMFSVCFRHRKHEFWSLSIGCFLLLQKINKAIKMGALV